jgi:hypothetical protein
MIQEVEPKVLLLMYAAYIQYEVALKLLSNPTTSHEPYYTDTSIRTP